MTNDFTQSPPVVHDAWASDPALRSLLRRLLPEPVRRDVEPHLARLGARAATDLLALAEQAEREPPRLVQYDPWGARVDRIETSAAWRALDRVSAEEGLVAVAHERAHGPLSRVHQMAALYLFHPSSAIYSCPLAMTDGAARCLEVHGAGDPTLAAAYARLTTRDPDRFWTSGQWMTERTGGSDVSGTSTVATPNDDGTFALHGRKWFTSATTSQMALTLARIGTGPELSLFHVELRDPPLRSGQAPDGRLRGIRVDRLKDKLGTRALPTAELTLDGTPARLVGGPGNGVRKIAAVLNVTRAYNAVCAAGGMRRAVALARDYAATRVAFGRPLLHLPLHAGTLAALEVEARAALHLVLHVALLMGRDECGEATDAERRALRVLTPVAKLFTGKQAVAVASEALEAFGGAGYVEDTGLPRLLRDAQVLAIWEGTTNVLALDVLRALARDDALAPLLADLGARIDGAAAPPLAAAAARVRDALARTRAYADACALASAGARDERDEVEAGARAFALTLGRLTAASLLLEHAAWALAHEPDRAEAAAAVAAARRWCAGDLAPLARIDADERADARGDTAALLALVAATVTADTTATARRSART